MQNVRFLILILIFLIKSFGTTPINQLTIMATPIEPFVAFSPNQSTPIGLDVKIIENFAKRFKLKVNFIMTNKSLLEIFSSDGRAVPFLRSIKHLYVLINAVFKLFTRTIYSFVLGKLTCSLGHWVKTWSHQNICWHQHHIITAYLYGVWEKRNRSLLATIFFICVAIHGCTPRLLQASSL